MDSDELNGQSMQNELNAELRYFADMGDTDECWKLLEQGADVNAGDGEFTALRNAVVSGHASVCALLLSHGANLHTETSEDLTLFQLAVWYGHVEVVDYFLRERGEDFNQITTEGQTLIELAQSSYGNEEMVMHLLARRSEKAISAPLDASCDTGAAPLHQQSRRGAMAL